jgi:hypothetical protein
MSDSPLLSKMDALLKKHRGGVDNPQEASIPQADTTERSPPPDAWLPVLTQVIERGTPPATPMPAAPMPLPAAPSPAATSATAPPPPAEPAALEATAPSPVLSDTLAEQLMSELAPRLSEVMEKQVAAELRKNLDQTVSSLLSQLDVNVREIVRDAVAEKLKQPRDPSS